MPQNESQYGPHGTEAYALMEKADTCFEFKKYDSAFYYFNKSKSLFEIDKTYKNIAYCLYKMAESQQKYGDYRGCEETITELLPYKQAAYEAQAYNLLGIVSKELGNYDDAVKSYTQSMKLTESAANRLSPRNNIGVVYMLQGKYDEAILIFENILRTHLLDTEEYHVRKARVVDNLGFAYFKGNQDEKGLGLMHEALTARIEIQDTYGSIESYLHLAEYYKGKDHEKFRENALKGYETATSVNSVDERLESLQLLMTYNTEKGENWYARQFNFLNDSIKRVRGNAKNQFAKIRYDSKEAKEKQTKAELDLARQINKGNYYFIGILCLIAVLGYVFMYFRNKNRRERTEAVYKTETRISKQLHDELANDVFHAMTFAETQDLHNPLKKEALLENLDKIYSRTRNISTENSTIDTGEQFDENLKEMLSGYNSDGIKIIIRDNKDIDWNAIQKEKKIAVHRVLQELMVNMKKHSKCDLVVVGFVNSGKNIEIQYSDNGKGCTDKVILNNGLRNMENRIHGIKGTITFDSEPEKGFKVKVSFPK